MTNEKPQTIAITVSYLISTISALLFLLQPANADDGASPFVVEDGLSNGNHNFEKLPSSKDYYIRALKDDSEKHYADAIRDYSEAIRLNPHYGEAIANRGASKFNLQDFNGALRDYNEALKIFPNNKALQNLKAQVEGVLKENANQSANVSKQQVQLNQARIQSIVGGDFADPSTMIMMNARRRGLIPANSGDLSDPASIIMMNARRRGLIPANTPDP